MALPVTINQFSYRYEQESQTVLRDISVSIPAGSCCALLGPTGAGKTTLLYAIAGVLGHHHSPGVSSGSITIGKQSYTPLPKTILFPQVGLTLQDPSLQISGVRESVFTEIAFTLENLGVPEADQTSRIQSLLEQLGIAHLAERKPTTLSGGEVQRVALATIIVARPDVLLLDEPTTALDYNAQSRLQNIIKSIQRNTTIVFSDTRIDFALDVADIFVVIDNGSVRFVGNRKEFLTKIDSFRSILPVEGWSNVIGLLNEHRNLSAKQKLTTVLG